MSDSTKVFASGRKHSGFGKSISGWTAFLFGLHCISLSSSGLIPFSWVSSVWPGASIAWVLTIAVVLCIVHGLAFAMIGISEPHEGADYVLSSRTLSPTLGFATSWTLVLFSGVVAGGLAAWVPKTALPTLLRPLALIFNEPRYDDLATLISNPSGTLIFGIAIILIAAVTTAQKQTDVLRAMLNAGLVFGLLAWVVIYYSLASAADPGVFKLAWNKFMGASGTYGCFDCRIPLATAAGMKIDHSFVSTTMAGLIMGFWIYYGYYIPTFFSEEIKKPISRSLIWASAGSLVFAYLIFLTGTLLLGRLVPSDWIAAEGYLFNNPDLASKAAHGQTIAAMPWITFYAAILKPYAPLILIVAFGWIFTLINLVQTYLFYSGRILWSWSADQVMPDWVFGPSANQASPSRSIAIVAVLAIVGLADSAFSGPLGTQLTFAFFAVVTQLVPVTALILIPILNKDAFMRLPSYWRRPICGVPLSSLLGSVALCYLLWMVIASFLYPAAGVANPSRTLGLLAAFLLSGVLVFRYMSSYRRSRGIDLKLTFRSSPDSELLEDARFD